ncbi:MAG: hypothetical protein ACT4NX_04395 [Deltaproteobacteria bacterium]
MREVRKLLDEVKSGIRTLARRGRVEAEKPAYDVSAILGGEPPIEDERAPQSLRRSYESLYADFAAKNFDSIREFIAGRDKTYLAEFAKVNNLSIDARRASKERIIEEVMKRLAERRAISRRVT